MAAPVVKMLAHQASNSQKENRAVLLEAFVLYQ